MVYTFLVSSNAQSVVFHMQTKSVRRMVRNEVLAL